MNEFPIGRVTCDRPHMPDAYGLDRRTVDGTLTWDDVSERLRAARNFWLATAHPPGVPHVAPLWGCWFDNALWFSTDPQSRKGRNLVECPEVAAHLESGDDVVIVYGRAADAAEHPLLEPFMRAYEGKYGLRPDAMASACVVRVAPHTVLAWKESAFPASATRWRLP